MVDPEVMRRAFARALTELIAQREREGFEGKHAVGGIVRPQTWRVIDAGPDGCFIPLRNTARSTLLRSIGERLARDMRGGENGDK